MYPKIINIRATDCPIELEKKYIRWYEEVHVPMLFKIEEVRRVTRFECVDYDGSHPKFLSIYEFDDIFASQRYESSIEVAEAKADVSKTWPESEWKHRWKVKYKVTKVWE
jgi:hypothetical protein